MEDFFASFSNREISLFIWIFIAIVSILFNKSLRKSIGGIIKSFFVKSILTVISLFFGYIFIVTYGLSKFEFWNISLLKDTLFWTFGFAIVLVLKVNTVKRIAGFKAILKDAVKWTIIIEFLIAFYSFSLITELIVLPILFVIMMTQAYSDTDEKYVQVNSFLKRLLNLIGVIILGYVSIKTFYQTEGLLTISNLKSLVLPIIMTISFIPFVYFLSLYMIYENLFGRLKFFIQDNLLRKRIEKQILNIAKLDLDKISNISENITSERPLTLENSFDKIKQISEPKQNLLNS